MTLRVLALWLFMIGVASRGFVRSLSQERTLRMTRAYLAFCAVVGTIQLVFWLLWPGVYNSAYWTFEVAHNVLLCFLSGEIIRSLLPRRFVIPWTGIALAIPLIMLLVRLPLKPTAALVIFSTSAGFTGGILLMSLFFMSVNWTKEHRVATSGIVALLLADLLSFFGIFGNLGPSQISAVQLAPLLGLLLLSYAGRPKQTGEPAHGNAGPTAEIPSKSESARGGHAA